MTRHGLNERLQAFVAYVCPPESMRVLRIKSLWWGRYGMAGVSRLREATAAEGVEAIGVYLQVCVCVCVYVWMQDHSVCSPWDATATPAHSCMYLTPSTNWGFGC